jgi:hypothetical protein
MANTKYATIAEPSSRIPFWTLFSTSLKLLLSVDHETKEAQKQGCGVKY